MRSGLVHLLDKLCSLSQCRCTEAPQSEIQSVQQKVSSMAWAGFQVLSNRCVMWESCDGEWRHLMSKNSFAVWSEQRHFLTFIPMFAIENKLQLSKVFCKRDCFNIVIQLNLGGSCHLYFITHPKMAPFSRLPFSFHHSLQPDRSP